jgi:hypothetical protein
MCCCLRSCQRGRPRPYPFLGSPPVRAMQTRRGKLKSRHDPSYDHDTQCMSGPAMRKQDILHVLSDVHRDMDNPDIWVRPLRYSRGLALNLFHRGGKPTFRRFVYPESQESQCLYSRGNEYSYDLKLMRCRLVQSNKGERQSADGVGEERWRKAKIARQSEQNSVSRIFIFNWEFRPRVEFLAQSWVCSISLFVRIMKCASAVVKDGYFFQWCCRELAKRWPKPSYSSSRQGNVGFDSNSTHRILIPAAGFALGE